MEISISQWKTFLEIVRTGSYSKASKKFFITQSAVSHQIKNLEQELNFKLFERVGHKMKLTSRGEILSSAVGKFLDDLDYVKKISEDSVNSFTGNLTISATHGILIYILPNIIKKYRDNFPGINLKLASWRSHSDSISMVLNSEVDFAIRPRINQVFSDKVSYLPWKSFNRVLIISKNHPIRKKKLITLAEVSRYPLILYGERTKQAIDDAFAQQKLTYEVIMQLDVTETAKKYVQTDIGASIIDSFTLTREDMRKFHVIDLSHLLEKVDYGIYYRKDRYISNAMREFVNYFAPELSGHFAP